MTTKHPARSICNCNTNTYINFFQLSIQGNAYILYTHLNLNNKIIQLRFNYYMLLTNKKTLDEFFTLTTYIIKFFCTLENFSYNSYLRVCECVSWCFSNFFTLIRGVNVISCSSSCENLLIFRHDIKKNKTIIRIR